MPISSQQTPLLHQQKPINSFQSIPPPAAAAVASQSTRHEGKEPINNNNIANDTTEAPTKLGTFDGVFIPTALNVLSILMFLRFGFIIGQLGILGSLGVLIMSYLINTLTVLSISAIATNGTVRGGGAYYMISRSLGPEFGGSIGLIFYIGQVLNSGLNVVGIIEPLLNNFGLHGGEFAELLPRGQLFELVYASALLLGCICIALVGSALVSRCGSLLFVLLLIATVSIPISSIFVNPFIFKEYELLYTGPTWDTVKGNLLPEFTKGAAGSLLTTRENFNDLFGIFFPATAGIFAGASMSGDLRKPSKSIPKGTIWGLVLTFVCYALVILALGASVPRELLRKDITIIQDVNLSAGLIFIGELATSLFSIIVGIVGAANVLQAIAKDSIFPFLRPFEQVSKGSNNPINAILFTWLLTQLCLFANINQIATFITMAFLMTFIVTNLACFLLKIASAPNFRPSFRFFTWWTALSGLISCTVAMFIVDGVSAALVVVFLIMLFLMIHYFSPPKPWGDVSQSLIYHQVRKYLLRLRQDNVKYWRPQILLLVDNPRSSWNLIQFCNNLKKGGLYILGHVIVSESFQNNYDEFKTQTNAWIKLRDLTKVKAFVQIGLGPSLPWGVRNVILGSGLGGMKPNIVVMGFLNREKHHETYLNTKRNAARRHMQARSSSISMERLPTDSCRSESKMSLQNWVNIIEDLVLMRTNVAVAKGFETLAIPSKQSCVLPDEKRPYIDLYPIQMSAAIVDKNGEQSAMTTNFDTYTLILQLGAILTTVPNWKRTHKLRIVLFVEDREDMANERERLESLLEILRIQAVILVVCLKDFKTYNTIINGSMEDFHHVDTVLKTDEFWNQLKDLRASQTRMSVPDVTINGHRKSFSGAIGGKISDLLGEGTLTGTSFSKKYGLGKLQRMGVSLTMTSNKFNNDVLDNVSDDDSVSCSGDVSDLESIPSISNNNNNNHRSATLHEDFMNRFKPATTSTTSVNPPLFKEQYRPKLQTRPSDTSYFSTTAAAYTTTRSDLHQTPSALNINALKKKPVPNFSSEKLLRSRAIDDAIGDEPSIMLAHEDERDQDRCLDNSSTISSKHSINRNKNSASSGVKFATKEESTYYPPANLSARKKKSSLDDSIDPLTSDVVNTSSSPDDSAITAQKPSSIDQELVEDATLININDLSFDDLPAKAQHLVLNNIMKTISSSSETGVIFSTLPAPVIGTHYSEDDSQEYVENLEIWCEGLGAVLLINSQSMTVTTAL